jgi:hypothetical protein
LLHQILDAVPMTGQGRFQIIQLTRQHRLNQLRRDRGCKPEPQKIPST